MDEQELLQTLIGQWYFTATTLPAVLKGDRPVQLLRKTVALKQRDKRTFLEEEVFFTYKDKQRTIKGQSWLTDVQTLTFLYKSPLWMSILLYQWQVKLMDPLGNWLVLYYSKSFFSADSLHLLSRTQLPDTTLNDILQQLRALKDAQLQRLLPRLRLL